MLLIKSLIKFVLTLKEFGQERSKKKILFSYETLSIFMHNNLKNGNEPHDTNEVSIIDQFVWKIQGVKKTIRLLNNLLN